MDTIIINIPTDDWVDISQGKVQGLITNRFDHSLLYRKGTAKPLATNRQGHRLISGEDLHFKVTPGEEIYARGLSKPGRVAVTYGAAFISNPISFKPEDVAGKVALNTIFGETRSAMQFDDVSVNFHYGLSTRQLKITESTGTGSVGASGSDALIECGTGVGTGLLESLDAVRYRAGHETLCHITHNQSELQDGVDVQHGLLNIEDGLAIGSQGTIPGVWFIEGSNENFIPNTTGAPIDPDDNLTQFNMDPLDGTGPSGFNLDMTKRNLFGITMGYLSIAPIYFMVEAGKLGWIPFHVLDFTNTQTEGHLKNPNLPVSCKVRRATGSGTSVTVESGSWRAGVAGGDRLETGADRWFDFEDARVNIGSINIGVNPNLYQNMFSLRNKTTFNGKPNHIRIEVGVVNFITSGNKSVEFVGILGGTLSGNDAFVDKDSVNSVIETSINGTVEGVSGGARTILGPNSDRRTDVQNTGILLRPGQTFTLGIRGLDGVAFNGDVVASFRWKEEF